MNAHICASIKHANYICYKLWMKVSCPAQLIRAWYWLKHVLCSGWICRGTCAMHTYIWALASTEVLRNSAPNVITQLRYAMQCSITTNGSLEPVVYVLDFVSQLWEEILEGFCTYVVPPWSSKYHMQHHKTLIMIVWVEELARLRHILSFRRTC